MSQNFTLVNTNFLVDKSTNYAVDTTTGPVAAELPQSRIVPIGQCIHFVNVGSGQLTITTTDATIDGSTSLVVDKNVSLLYLGNRWAAFGQPQAQTPTQVQAPVTRPVKPRTPVEDTIASSQQT